MSKRTKTPVDDAGRMSGAAVAPPSTNGANGRDARGRFAKGNTGGPGNPYAAAAAQFRAAIFAAVTAEDVRAIVKKMVELAKAGDLVAARLIFDRTVGPPVELDLLERLEKLEAAQTGWRP
jgi:hypothetical protein